MTSMGSGCLVAFESWTAMEVRNMETLKVSHCVCVKLFIVHSPATSESDSVMKFNEK